MYNEVKYIIRYIKNQKVTRELLHLQLLEENGQGSSPTLSLEKGGVPGIS